MNTEPKPAAVEVFGEFIKVPEGGKCGTCKEVHIYFVNEMGRVRCAGCAGVKHAQK